MGYSPERINQREEHHLSKKNSEIVSGSKYESLMKISKLYSSIISAGVFETKNIKTVEAAKVIENAQRDVNIAFINELTILFGKMNINIHDVLEAAETK